MPLFTAVSSSARQLHNLLRCINFTRDTQIQISSEGLRFSVEEALVMQGLAFLEKSLFTNFHYDFPGSTQNEEQDSDGEHELPTFLVSLPALLETLAIFGFADSKDNANRGNYRSAASEYSRGGSVAPISAFDNRALGVSGICRLSYEGLGHPLRIALEENSVTTTCQLVTYEPEGAFEDIPFNRDQLSLKIIMRASYLHDAIIELAATSPERVTMIASPSSAPHFSLSAVGPLGSASFDFEKDPQLLETFQCPQKIKNTYKFSMIKGARFAMGVASKVSIRGDEQGVLSLQFMIEMEGGDVSFIDFRFVPFIPEEDDESERSSTDGDDAEDEINE